MAHDLTLNSAATFAASPVSTFGQALQSGGSGVSAASLFSAAGASLEVECVIEYATAPSTNAIIAMQDYLFALAFTSAGKIQAWIGYVSGTNTTVTSPGAYADGKSHRVALIYSNATMQLLVDGAAVATAAISSTVQAAMSWTKQVFGVGFYPGSSKPYTNAGVIDEVAIFSPTRDSGAYTPTTSPYTGSESGLVALYHLDGDGTDSASASVTSALSGPSRAPTGSASTFVLTLGSAALTSAVTFTPSDAGAGGVFSPTTISIAVGATTGSFSYTPAAAGAVSLSTTNSGGVINPPALSLTTYAPLSLSGVAATAGSASVTIAATAAMTGGDGIASGYEYRLYRATAATGLPPTSTTATPLFAWTGPSVGDHSAGWTPSFTDTSGATGATYYYAIEGADQSGDAAYFATSSVVYPQGATTSTTYSLSGPSALTVGHSSTYTLTPNGSTGPSADVVVTPSWQLSGVFSPLTVTLPAGSTAAHTFAFTPSVAGSGALGVTNNGGLLDPAALTVTAAAPSTEAIITPDNAAITYSPYNWQVGSQVATSVNPGAYLNFCFTGTNLQIACDVTQNLAPFPQIWVTIDGQAPQLFTAAATITPIIPAATASWPVHTVEIQFKSATCTQSRWSPQNTSLKITSFTLALGATVSSMTAYTKNVLIYGDSISEGYLSISAVGNSTDASVSDSSLAWAYRQRAALGANIGVVAFTGSGLTVTGNGNVPPLTTTWNMLWGGQLRNFSPAPDLIVLNEGTNDGAKKATAAAVQAAMTTVLQNLVATCPATRIVVLQPYQGRATYMTADELATVTTGLQAAVAAVNNANITFAPTTGWFTASMPSADGTHPLGISTAASIAPRAAATLAPVLTSSTTRSFFYY